jgi:hypothetical protein
LGFAFFVDDDRTYFYRTFVCQLADRPNTGSGRTLIVPEPKTKDFMRLLVQLTKGTA